MNKVILIGRLGKDPEVSKTKTDKSVCNLSVATSEFRNGEKSTEWHRVVVWNETAENCAKYLEKGSQVGVEGRITTRKWEDADGKEKYSTEIMADRVEFLGSKGEKDETPKVDF